MTELENTELVRGLWKSDALNRKLRWNSKWLMNPTRNVIMELNIR